MKSIFLHLIVDELTGTSNSTTLLTTADAGTTMEARRSLQLMQERQDKNLPRVILDRPRDTREKKVVIVDIDADRAPQALLSYKPGDTLYGSELGPLLGYNGNYNAVSMRISQAKRGGSNAQGLVTVHGVTFCYEADYTRPV